MLKKFTLSFLIFTSSALPIHGYEILEIFINKSSKQPYLVTRVNMPANLHDFLELIKANNIHVSFNENRTAVALTTTMPKENFIKILDRATTL